MNDSDESMRIDLFKDNNSEANQFPRLQIFEHLFFEAVILPHLEIKGDKELGWHGYLRIFVE